MATVGEYQPKFHALTLLAYIMPVLLFTFRLLIENYANKEIPDYLDKLPIDIAREKQYHKIVNLLNEHRVSKLYALAVLFDDWQMAYYAPSHSSA